MKFSSWNSGWVSLIKIDADELIGPHSSIELICSSYIVVYCCYSQRN